MNCIRLIQAQNKTKMAAKITANMAAKMPIIMFEAGCDFVFHFSMYFST